MTGADRRRPRCRRSPAITFAAPSAPAAAAGEPADHAITAADVRAAAVTEERADAVGTQRLHRHLLQANTTAIRPLRRQPRRQRHRRLRGDDRAPDAVSDRRDGEDGDRRRSAPDPDASRRSRFRSSSSGSSPTSDLSFFAGPNFTFGGRIHTNGNLWLAQGTGRDADD